jgi:hypothetical protein
VTKIAGSGSASGSISQRHGSADPDPEPPQMSWIRNTAFLYEFSVNYTTFITLSENLIHMPCFIYSLGQCCVSGMFIPDPGSEFFHCRSRIRIRIKEFKYFQLQKRKTKNWILDVHPGSRIWISSILDPDPGCRHRIADPDPPHCTCRCLL